jgi:hypothetical protein
MNPFFLDKVKASHILKGLRRQTTKEQIEADNLQSVTITKWFKTTHNTVPFGYRNSEWQSVVSQFQPGDQFWEYEYDVRGVKCGYALIREKEVIWYHQTSAVYSTDEGLTRTQLNANQYKPQTDQITKAADLIRCYSAASAGACCDILDVLKIPVSGNLQNALMAESMSFYISMVQSELMMRRKGATKEHYQLVERDIGRALSQLGIRHKDFFVFSMFHSDERFRKDVFRYYRGSMAEFGLFVAHIQGFASRNELNIPSDDSFEMAVSIFYFRMINICGYSECVDSTTQLAANKKLIAINGDYITEFLDLMRQSLDAC